MTEEIYTSLAVLWTLPTTNCCSPSWWQTVPTVARTADRTTSQNLRRSRDVIGHVTIW